MKFTVFGEILWDVFGREKKIGGAPFNFAAHAVKMGAEVCFISAVGDDELGNEALKECASLGIGTGNIQIPDKPTGCAVVTLDNGTPRYDLVRGAAYDNILWPTENGSAAGNGDPLAADVFYFGTLAQRDPVSRESLKKILERNSFKEIFFDINIRQDYYSDEIINDSLKRATILKISREEIGVLKIAGSPEEICPAVMEKYPNLKFIIVTLDSDGSFVYTGDGHVIRSPKPKCNVVSTVGAGDSFSAGFMVSLMNGHSVEKCLETATAISTFVCEHQEAIPEYTELLVKNLNV